MNNIGGSDEWSTGCESGWTIYLDESAYISTNNQSYYINSGVNDHIDDQDLSMVSDASSGPPLCKNQDNDDEQRQCYYSRSNQNNCYSENKSSKKTQKRLKKPNKKDQNKVGFNKHNDDDDNQQYVACFSSSNLLLDDTASSRPFSHSQIYGNNPSSMVFSQSASSTLFQADNSSYTNQYAFWQSSQVNDAYNSAQPSQWREGWQ